MKTPKEKAHTLVMVADAYAELQDAEKRLIEKRLKLRRVVGDASPYFRASVIANVLGTTTGWVVARRQGKKYRALPNEYKPTLGNGKVS